MPKKPATDKKRMPAGDRGSSLDLELEESELRYRRLFETAQDGILILDAESGKIIDANPFLLDLLDYPFEGLIGLRLWEIGQFKDIAASQEAFEALQTNEYIRYENLPLCSKGGKTIRVEFVSNVYYVGTHKVIQCNIRDISVRNELGISRDRVAALEVAGEQKDRIVAMLSHELRTPLAAISSMIDVVEMGHQVVGMIDQTDTSIPPQFDKTAVTLIRRNVGSLVHLINGMLDVTQIAKGRIEVELGMVDMHEAIRTVLKDVEGVRKEKLISIDLYFEAMQQYVQGDAGKIGQILSNLIGNALKFTPKGGNISIVSRDDGDNLAVEIRDSGIGIPAEALQRIFSSFEQGDSSIHPRFGGLGLGLSIARSLVKAQGGTLRAESEGAGLGSKFTLRFQMQKPFFGEPFGTDLEPTKSRDIGLRILLVEDNEDARRCLRGLLAAKGHKVQAAADCKTAMELSDWNDFEVLIADMGLPDGCGFDLLQHMKKTDPKMHGIALSGSGMPEDLAASKAAGFTAHLVKPVEFSKLTEMLDRLDVPVSSDGLF